MFPKNNQWCAVVTFLQQWSIAGWQPKTLDCQRLKDGWIEQQLWWRSKLEMPTGPDISRRVKFIRSSMEPSIHRNKHHLRDLRKRSPSDSHKNEDENNADDSWRRARSHQQQQTTCRVCRHFPAPSDTCSSPTKQHNCKTPSIQYNSQPFP